MCKIQVSFTKVLVPALLWRNIRLNTGTETLLLLTKLTHSVLSTEQDFSEYNSYHLHQASTLNDALEDSLFFCWLQGKPRCLVLLNFVNISAVLLFLKCKLLTSSKYGMNHSPLPVILICQFTPNRTCPYHGGTWQRNMKKLVLMLHSSFGNNAGNNHQECRVQTCN